MHELLGPSSAHVAVPASAPLVDTSIMYAMTEDALPATLAIGVEGATAGVHARSSAMYTPIRNKRLSVSNVHESPDMAPAPLVIHPDAYLVPDPDYGYSPFEVELVQVQYPDHICDEFYENAMLLSCSDGLGRVWFESVRPTPLKLDGNKMKNQYSLNGEMGYNGMEAWVRGFNEREIMMMESVGLPLWRGIVSPDVSLHLENPYTREAMVTLRALLSSQNIGFQLRLCRMIMAPISITREWCMYVFDMKLKRLNVLDPVYTEHTKHQYRDKHSSIICNMLNGLKHVGAMLADGWNMDISD
ncbi:uncharacterized protein [Triticum aestivum]|uniref:uncharacterized protein isoform X2 n=1 Tax=Triticum aestivum TaxID=4565 RepID=UPI001D00ACF9|nr:uncharacterized protein LOC123135558 isoform X2 [Triticum aestivum]